MQGKTAFGGERDNSRQLKNRFHERKVARKPGTNEFT